MLRLLGRDLSLSVIYRNLVNEHLPWRPWLAAYGQSPASVLADGLDMALPSSVSPMLDSDHGSDPVGSSEGGRLVLSRTPFRLHFHASIDALMTQPAVSHECGIWPPLVVLGGSGLP